jgi:hypothetical protein
MQKVDRLGWADGICFVSYGLRIGIRVSDPELLERVVPLLPPGWKPARSPVVEQLYSLRLGGPSRAANVRRLNLVYTGSARTGRSANLDELLEGFERELHSYTASWAPKRVFVHAGAVGWRGRAIIVPGGESTGTTTLIAALVRAGATYYSDEYAVLDRQGRVHPFARPLQIRESSEERPRRCWPNELGGRSGRKPLPVALIALTEYSPGATWRPHQLSPGRGALELLTHSVMARYRAEVTLATLSRVVADAVILKGRRGEAEQMAQALLDRLE